MEPTRAVDLSTGQPLLVPGSHSALVLVAGRHRPETHEPPPTLDLLSPPGSALAARPPHRPPGKASHHTSDWPENDPDQSLNCSQTPPWPLGCASSAVEPPRHRNAIARNWAYTRPPPASREAPPPTARSLSAPAPTRSAPFRTSDSFPPRYATRATPPDSAERGPGRAPVQGGHWRYRAPVALLRAVPQSPRRNDPLRDRRETGGTCSQPRSYPSDRSPLSRYCSRPRYQKPGSRAPEAFPPVWDPVSSARSGRCWSSAENRPVST